jgi:DNA primase
MTISDEKKEEIKQAADIVEVIGDHVRLKRSGSGYTGLCPFHNEKTPSFHVAPHLGSGIYKCFGCGRTGDVVSFMMELEGVGFVEAMRALADRYHIHLPEDNDQEFDPDYQLREGVFHALRFAAVYYYRVLKESDEAEQARRYLKERGFSPEIIKNYGLGYSLDRWDGLLKHAESAGVNPDYLAEAGLIKENQNGTSQYDTFRGRVMFPIFNTSKRVIAFGGRTLSNDKKTAKYINSPVTVVYNKSVALYGIQVAKNEIRKKGEAILVEGYTDVLALHQAGFKNAISTSGTSLTSGQLKVIHKYGDELLMLFDADQAGQNAMRRGLNLALAEGLTARLLQLPDGEDPDTFIKQYGSESFQKIMDEKSEGFLEYLVRRAKGNKRWDNAQQQREMIEQILKTIALISDQIEREALIMNLSHLTGIGDRSLFKELERLIPEVKKERERIEKAEREEFKRQKERNREAKQNFQPRDSQGPSYQNSQSADGPPPGPDNEDMMHPADRMNEAPAGPRDFSEESVGYGDQESEKKENNAPKPRKKKAKMPSYEKEIIRVMLQFGDEMVAYIGSKVNADFFKSKELADFFDNVVDRYEHELPISVDYYTGAEAPYPQLVADIFLEMHSVSESLARKGVTFERDKSKYETAKGALKSMYLAYYDHLLDELRNDLRVIELSDEEPQKKRHKKAEINHQIKEVMGKRTDLQKMNLGLLFADEDPEEEVETKQTDFKKLYLSNNNED